MRMICVSVYMCSGDEKGRIYIQPHTTLVTFLEVPPYTICPFTVRSSISSLRVGHQETTNAEGSQIPQFRTYRNRTGCAVDLVPSAFPVVDLTIQQLSCLVEGGPARNAGKAINRYAVFERGATSVAGARATRR
jgi:hypothetical protein